MEGRLERHEPLPLCPENSNSFEGSDMRMRFHLSIFLILAVGLVGVVAGEPSAEQPSVFDMPGIQLKHALLQAKLAASFKAGNFVDAETHCRAAVQLVPHQPEGHYSLACVLARQGKTDLALASLEKAVELGFNKVEQIKRDDNLASLRDEERFKKAVEDAATAKPDPAGGWRFTVKPAVVKDGVATVDEGNTAWDPKLGVFRTFFKLDTVQEELVPIAKKYGEAGRLLRKFQREGVAAGNRGDLYDNHDSDHSNMNYATFPQLTRIEYGEVPKAKQFHHGLQTRYLHSGVTIGNSSTAITGGLFWRSQPRLALVDRRTASLLFLQYMANHLYLYPEHRDHDPGHNGKDGGYGDVYPVNTPYLIISQGSSGTDRVFLDALAATLAAFRPEVKRELAKKGALMPAVQMIFRRSNKPVTDDETYLTGVAHPTVFGGKRLDVAEMVVMAHEITKDALPPLVQIKVTEEDEPVLGRDCFDGGKGEKLFDTPCAIARVVRGVNYNRRMVVSAKPSKDLCGRPLTYHWSVLRGNAKRIKITKLNDEGSMVVLTVGYHQRYPIGPGNAMESNRVDIGAFVHNGEHYSAPAFVTFYYLDNEKRVYDAKQRIQMVDYADPEVSKNYVDPALDVTRDWRDEYHYDEAGAPAGWTRIRGKSKEEFTAEGLLITAKDEKGQPTKGRRVGYVLKPRQNKTPIVEEVATEATEELE